TSVFSKELAVKFLQHLTRVLRPTNVRVARRGLWRTTLRLDTLEPRETPAGNVLVSFATGTLTLATDTKGGFIGSQDITIQDLSGAGSAQLVANDGETFTGAGAQFTGVNNIVVKFGAGNDLLHVGHIQITGGLTVTGGSGENHVYITTASGDNSFGSVTIKNSAGFN